MNVRKIVQDRQHLWHFICYHAHQTHSENGSTLKGKNIVSKGRKFCSIRVDSFDKTSLTVKICFQESLCILFHIWISYIYEKVSYFIEPGQSKMACAFSRDWNQLLACTFAQPNQCLLRVAKDPKHLKTLVSHWGCAGWSETSLDAMDLVGNAVHRLISIFGDGC